MAKLTNIERQINRSDFFKFTSLGQFVYNLIRITIGLGAILSFAWLIWGGIEYIVSGGNQEQLKSAKDKISSALIGLAILASVWTLWRLVIYFFGLSPTTQGPIEIEIPTP